MSKKHENPKYLELSRDDVIFLLECGQNLADCLDEDASDWFYECKTAIGEFDRENVQIMGNLINRADNLRDYARKMTEGLELDANGEG